MRPIAISMAISTAGAITLCAIFRIFPLLFPIFCGITLALNLLLWGILWILSLFVNKNKVYEKPSKFYSKILNFGYAYI